MRTLWLLIAMLAATGLTACGDSSSPSSGPAKAAAPAQGRPRVTLKLLGGGAAVPLSSCGFKERYPTYRFGGFVRYTGRVTPAPAGHWQVKVKLKRCIPHGYSETFFEFVRGRPDGTFAGMVPKLNPNTFYVRADYQAPAGTVRSPLAFFRTVGHG